MSTDDVREALDHWRTTEINHREAREELIELLIVKLDKQTITELAAETGIRRTTLYYMIFGKGGKDGKRSSTEAA
jgi:transcriptional regulator of acetoin/glycerol metabolism